MGKKIFKMDFRFCLLPPNNQMESQMFITHKEKSDPGTASLTRSSFPINEKAKTAYNFPDPIFLDSI